MSATEPSNPARDSSYALGVDLGTTYTAAAIRRGERLEIVDLGTRNAAIPSVVYLREDGTVLTGEAAIRRGATDPARLSREFKRRMGDTTAILLGGAPYSVDALMAAMLRSVVATVTERQGAAPSAIAIAHPANWGQYKKDLLDQAVRRADLDHVRLVTEPQAAAVHYASSERLEAGATVAVYDLGGGTFDAAVLRKTVDGFELLGEPEGIERLGGIDFDEAVFRHAVGALGGVVDELDPTDPVAQAAVSRLRDECVAAKEALSSDTEVSIPVILPTVQTEVRLTRAEFEAMIRPALGDTLIVLRRAMRSAGLDPADLHSVLLVGGSSRIPLISQMVGADLGRPVALDIHPKHSVALGAATLATVEAVRSTATAGPPAATVAAPVTTAAPTAPAGSGDNLTPPAAPAGALEPPPIVIEPIVATPATTVIPSPAAAAPGSAVPPTWTPTAEGRPDGGLGDSGLGDDGLDDGRRSRLPLVVGAVAAAALIGVAAFAVAANGGDGDAESATTTVRAITTIGAAATTSAPGTTAPGTPATSPSTSPSSSPSSSPSISPAASTPPTTTAQTEPPITTPVDPCAGITDAPCIVVDAVRVTADGSVEVTWSPRNFEPDVASGFHAHLFWNNASAEQAGNGAADQVAWDAVEAVVHTSDEVLTLGNKPPDATGVCATVGIAPAHTAYNPELFHCLPLPDE